MADRQSGPGEAALVGDIGSTNVRFALVPLGGPPARLDAVASLPCREHGGLVEAVEDYLSGVGVKRPRNAAVAVAGPVTGDRVALTNLDWSFSIEATRQALGLERLLVLNDFSAVARSLRHLEAADLISLGGGAPVAGEPLAVIGPGTGLGVSALVPCGRQWRPLASEGGHASLAPVTEREEAVAAWLRRRYGRVSWERVLSGPGLVNLYAAVAALEGRMIAEADLPGPAAVTGRGLDGSCKLCGEALDLFCAMLGTAAGDLALVVGARGGVYLAGGIAPRLRDLLPRSAFRQRFEAKGRLSAYAAAIPAQLVMAPHAGLVGAAVALGEEPFMAGD